MERPPLTGAENRIRPVEELNPKKQLALEYCTHAYHETIFS